MDSVVNASKNASNGSVEVKANVTMANTTDGSDGYMTIDVYLDGKLMNSAQGSKSALMKGIDVLKTVSPNATVRIEDEAGDVVKEQEMQPGKKYQIYVST